jgi:hypothetical protein
VLPTSPPRTLRGVWEHEALRSCSPRASDGDWAPSAACLASIDARVRREAAARGRRAPDDEPLERLYLPYTLRGHRYVLAIVYPTDASLDTNAAFFRELKGSSPVPSACGATDGGPWVFEETYVVGEAGGERASASQDGLEAHATPLASCTGESGASWQTACAAYEPPPDSTIRYSDPCDWYYREPPPDVAVPGRYDRAVRAEAQRIVQAKAGSYDRLELLAWLSELCLRRCTLGVRAELWDLRAAVAREMGWQDGARRAQAQAASLRAQPAAADVP